MKKPRIIRIKKSSRTGKLFWTMTGRNGEKMAHSQGYDKDSYSYLKSLMRDFQKAGFEIDTQGLVKV